MPQKSLENRKSFIKVDPSSDFPIQNLPYGIFVTKDRKTPRAGVAIGNYVMDLSVLDENGLLEIEGLDGKQVFHQADLNAFMELGYPVWSATRQRLIELLDEDNGELRDNATLREKAFVLQSDAQMLLPIKIGDYTDFYASKYHATNVGTMFRGPDNALQPNYLHLPVGYHGRSSSVVVSGTDIHRPKGQTVAGDSEVPKYTPSRLIDYELEVGFVVGTGNELGDSISVQEAEKHIFGLVLVNDWSARDVQKWEYVPLGPFLSKNFATSISPWVVPLEALNPFRVDGPRQEPAPLDYLKDTEKSSFDIELSTTIENDALQEPFTLTKTNMKYLYWSIFQQLAHHTATGCNLRTGDLMATGTVSGPEKENRACLLELTWRGSEPVELPNGEIRRFLEDGDRIAITGSAKGNGYSVGFGSVTGKLLPVKV